MTNYIEHIEIQENKRFGKPCLKGTRISVYDVLNWLANGMTKQEIVDQVSNATGLTKVETETIMNGIMSTIIQSLADNKKVELRGFGTFGIKHRMPKKARNPGTGEAIYLPERYVPTFKPSKLMRSRVNELINR